MSTPIPDHDLLALLLGDFAGEPADRLARAVEADPVSAARLGRLRSLLTDLTDGAEVDGLFEVDRARVIALAGATAPAGRSGVLDRVREVLAKLSFDTGHGGPALAGYRSGGGPRRLRVETEALGVELEVELVRDAVGPVPGSVSVLGRVVSGGPADAAWLESEGTDAIDAEVDDAGFFEFTVPPGRYELRVRGSAHTLHAPGLWLGEAGAAPPGASG